MPLMAWYRRGMSPRLGSKKPVKIWRWWTADRYVQWSCYFLLELRKLFNVVIKVGLLRFFVIHLSLQGSIDGFSSIGCEDWGKGSKTSCLGMIFVHVVLSLMNSSQMSADNPKPFNFSWLKVHKTTELDDTRKILSKIFYLGFVPILTKC